VTNANLVLFARPLEIVEDAELPQNAQDVTLGAWRGHLDRISLRPGLTPAQAGATLCHEVVEAVNDEQQLELNHTAISVIGNAIYEFIRSNRVLIERISAGASIFPGPA